MYNAKSSEINKILNTYTTNADTMAKKGNNNSNYNTLRLTNYRKQREKIQLQHSVRYRDNGQSVRRIVIIYPHQLSF